MEKEDVRYQTLAQLHERREQVVLLHKKGVKVMQIVAMTELSYPTVKQTLTLYRQGDWSAIHLHLEAEWGKTIGY